VKLQDQTLVRKFISQNGSGYTALSITNGSSYTDADPGSLQLNVYFNQADPANPGELLSQPPGNLIVTATADQITWVDTGHYSYDIGPPNTMYRGVLTMVWTYAVNGQTLSFYDNAQILNQMPLYDSLRDSERSVVEEVSWMLGDLFDSSTGGPNLIEPFQTHFDYERLAQCEKRAVTRMNLIGFPVMYWGVGPDTQEVNQDFHGLLVLGTYLEVVRFLVASYTEIPVFQGSNITFADRRDYQQRWNTIWTQEWPEYVTYTKMAKRKLLSLGRGALLVGGGIYGGNALGIFQAGTYASQVRSWRFYPAAPSISWGSTNHGAGIPGGL